MADSNFDTVVADALEVETIAISGVTVDTAVLLASGQAVDLNGEAGGIIFDADANTKMYASADDVITINIGGAADFRLAANTFTALSGSTIATNTIAETTAASGVTVDGVLIKDTTVDVDGTADAVILDADADTTISAPTDDQIDFELNSVDHVVMKAVAGADAGTTTNIVEIAFSSPVDTTGTNVHNALNIDVEVGNASGGTNSVRAIAIDAITGDAQVTETAIHIGSGWDVGIAVDTIGESTNAAGVTIDGVLVKDTAVLGRTHIVAVTADGAITVPAYNVHYFITKAGVAAMTIVDPTATTHDGVTLTFVATTANAHTLSNAAGSGFFSTGGSGKDVATFGGAIGDGLTIIAYQGKWYVDPRGVTNITLG